jgi:hypothetical protein
MAFPWAALPANANLPARILLSVTVVDFVHWVALCSRVCREWRSIVRSSPAFCASIGLGKRGKMTQPGWKQRARVLVAISRALQRIDRTFRANANKVEIYGEQSQETLDHWVSPIDRPVGCLEIRTQLSKFGGKSNSQVAVTICGAGNAAVAAALNALPTPLPLTELILYDFGGAIAPTVVPTLRRKFAGDGLLYLSVSSCWLGNDGTVALAAVLPSTLKCLDISGTGCGDAGLVALAGVLPTAPNLQKLWCGINRQVGEAGTLAVVAALPKLRALRQLYANFDICSETSQGYPLTGLDGADPPGGWGSFGPKPTSEPDSDRRGPGSGVAVHWNTKCALALAEAMPHCAATLGSIDLSGGFYGCKTSMSDEAQATLKAAWIAYLERYVGDYNRQDPRGDGLLKVYRTFGLDIHENDGNWGHW